jgi:hypothetical protein
MYNNYNNFQRGYSYEYSYVNPLNPYIVNNQTYIMNYNQNFSKNSSIASVIQCLSYCFKEHELVNFRFFTEESKLFSYDIVTIIEKVSIEKQEIFKMSIQNFRNKASQIIPNYYSGTEEIEPIDAFFGLCSYINKEFKEQNNNCPNLIYLNFEEMKEIPKADFPKVYETIEDFKNEYHSPFANSFYYILLNLIK